MIGRLLDWAMSWTRRTWVTAVALAIAVYLVLWATDGLQPLLRLLGLGA